MKNNPMYYLSTPDTLKIGLRQAFFDGFRTAMKIAENANGEELKKLFAHHEDAWIFRLVYEYEEQRDKELRETIAFALARCGFDKAGFRAFVFEQDAINDTGVAIDRTNGTPIEDEFFRPLPNQPYQPYRNSKVTRRGNPNITMATADYFALPESERRQWRYKAWFDIMDHDYRLLRVTTNDEAYITELIRQDILCGDPIIDRYVVESGINPGDRCANRLLDYCSTIADAIQDLTKENRLAALYYPPIVISQIKDGHIGSVGQLRLTQIFSMIYESKLDTLRLQVAEFLTMLVELFQFDGTDQTLPIWLTLDDIDSYIDVANKPLLRGLQTYRDTDGNPTNKLIDAPDQASAEEKCLLLKQHVMPRLSLRIVEALNRSMLSSEAPDGATPTIEMTDAIAKAFTPTGNVQFSGDGAIVMMEIQESIDQFYQLAKLLNMPEDSPFMTKVKKLQNLQIGQTET